MTKGKADTVSKEELFFKDKAFPSGITDEEWEEFKQDHEGALWPSFAIKILEEYAQAYAQTESKWIAGRPKIVCLCGSTRFGKAFQDANLKETMAGKIVLSIGCNMKSDMDIFGHLSEDELKEIKIKLDELHKRKIDLADEVLVLNVGGYIGESTRSEIDYAEKLNKPITYLEPLPPNPKEVKP